MTDSHATTEVRPVATSLDHYTTIVDRSDVDWRIFFDFRAEALAREVPPEIVADHRGHTGLLAEADRPCPRPSRVRFLTNSLTGETRPVGCRSQGCESCCLALARKTVRAIRLAGPSHLVTLTSTGDPTDSDAGRLRRERLNRFNRRVRIRVGASNWEAAYFVHKNPSEPTQSHIHLYVRGIVRHEVIEEEAVRVGFGREVHVSPMSQWSHGYGLHPIFATADLEAAEARKAIDEFRSANHGRLVRSTSSFWRDRSGNPCTLEQARRAGLNPWFAVARPPKDAS